MRNIFSLLVFVLSISPLIGQQSVSSVYETFEEMESAIMQRDNDTTYVINFWATWCSPCVKELPYFYNVEERLSDLPVKSYLVSLDFKRQITSKLNPFLQKNKVPNEVVVLLDGKANEWIDKVDANWSGAIPYTLVYKGYKRKGGEIQFHSEQELDDYIQSL